MAPHLLWCSNRRGESFKSTRGAGQSIVWLRSRTSRLPETHLRKLRLSSFSCRQLVWSGYWTAFVSCNDLACMRRGLWTGKRANLALCKISLTRTGRTKGVPASKEAVHPKLVLFGWTLQTLSGEMFMPKESLFAQALLQSLAARWGPWMSQSSFLPVPSTKPGDHLRDLSVVIALGR